MCPYLGVCIKTVIHTYILLGPSQVFLFFSSVVTLPMTIPRLGQRFFHKCLNVFSETVLKRMFNTLCYAHKGTRQYYVGQVCVYGQTLGLSRDVVVYPVADQKPRGLDQ